MKDSFYVLGVNVKEFSYRKDNFPKIVVFNRNIKVYGARNFKLDIFNISGRKVHSFKHSASEFLIPSGIRKGIYFLRLETENEVTKKKIIIFK